jgi:hypothetical protein
MRANRLLPLIAAMLASAAVGAWAQTTAPVKPVYQIPTSETSNENAPRGVNLGEGLSLYPSIGASFGRDDNLFLSHVNEKSSTVYMLAPGLKLQARGATSLFTVDLNSTMARYEQSRADDYTDIHFGGTGEFVLSSRTGLRLGAEYNKGHDARGSTDRAGTAEPDEYRNNGVNGLFAFGGNEARGRVELETGAYRKRYLNNHATTFASDRDNSNFAGRFFARFTPKTSFLIEARTEKFDYTSPVSLLDSRERQYLAGVTWDATAATSGTIKVGKIYKNFLSSRVADFSGTGWDATVQWAPMTYSRVGFYAIKDFGESTGIGDFVLSKRAGVNWTHDWNSRLSTIASLGRVNDDFTNGGRSDSTDSIGFKVNYRLHRWLTIGGELSNVDRDSNISTFRYKRNIYLLTVGATL